MKKAIDELRPEYKRSDFARLERGRFFAEVAKGTTVVLLSPKVAKVFPTSESVNEALSGLIEARRGSRVAGRPTRARAKAVGAD